MVNSDEFPTDPDWNDDVIWQAAKVVMRHPEHTERVLNEVGSAMRRNGPIAELNRLAVEHAVVTCALHELTMPRVLQSILDNTVDGLLTLGSSGDVNSSMLDDVIAPADILDEIQDDDGLTALWDIMSVLFISSWRESQNELQQPASPYYEIWRCLQKNRSEHRLAFDSMYLDQDTGRYEVPYKGTVDTGPSGSGPHAMPVVRCPLDQEGFLSVQAEGIIFVNRIVLFIGEALMKSSLWDARTDEGRAFREQVGSFRGLQLIALANHHLIQEAASTSRLTFGRAACLVDPELLSVAVQNEDVRITWVNEAALFEGTSSRPRKCAGVRPTAFLEDAGGFELAKTSIQQMLGSKFTPVIRTVVDSLYVAAVLAAPLTVWKRYGEVRPHLVDNDERLCPQA